MCWGLIAQYHTGLECSWSKALCVCAEIRQAVGRSEPLLSQWITAFVVRLKWHCAVWPQGRRRGRADQGRAATSLSERGGGQQGLGSCTVAPRYQRGPLSNGEAVRKLCRRWAVIYTFLPHSLHPPLPTAVLPTSYQRKQYACRILHETAVFFKKLNLNSCCFSVCMTLKHHNNIFRCLLFTFVCRCVCSQPWCLSRLVSYLSGRRVSSLNMDTTLSAGPGGLVHLWAVRLEQCQEQRRRSSASTSVTDRLQVIKAVCHPDAGEWKGRSVIKSHRPKLKPGLRSVTGRVNADRWNGVI